jgi:hypothetical protein
MATKDPWAFGSSGGPFDPNAWSNGAQQIGGAVGDATSNALLSAFGITPARAGKALHQTLVGLAGVLIIILGFILIVSGTKTAQTVARSAVKIGSAVAA